MKTIKIQMSKVTDNNVFEGVKWSIATPQQEQQALAVLAKIKGIRKQTA